VLFKLVLCDFSLQEVKERKIPPGDFALLGLFVAIAAKRVARLGAGANCDTFSGCLGHGFRLTEFFFVRRYSVHFASPRGSK
jgi:hypothetical protein